MAEFGEEPSLNEGGKLKDTEWKNGFFSSDDSNLTKCGVDESKNRLRSLFNQVLEGFLREVSTKRSCIRPLPVLNACGRIIDLFKLFWAVRNIGGYDVVSTKTLWDVVAEECGVGFEETASLKLVYIKYLSELDHWLQMGLTDSSSGISGSRIIEKLELMSNRLKNGDGVLSGAIENEEVDGSKFDMFEDKIASDVSKRVLDCSSSINNSIFRSQDCAIEKVSNAGEKDFLDDKTDKVESAKQEAKMVCEDAVDLFEVKVCTENAYSCFPDENGYCVLEKKIIDEPMSVDHCSTEINGHAFHEKLSEHPRKDVSVSTESVVDRAQRPQKRKRESLLWAEMLDWLSYVAKNSADPVIGKKNEHGNNHFRNQALLARKLLLIKRDNVNIEISHNQSKKQKMHPSMYEDDVPRQQPAENLRSSQRVPSVKTHSCKCCSSAAEHKTPEKAARNGPKEPLVKAEVSGSREKEYKYWEKPTEMHVFVGRSFQAEVPKWNGVVSVSDSKWLGEQTWSPEDAKVDEVVQLDNVGKGRPITCDCSFPGSTGCIRFHISEKRLKLKRELNTVFYKWRFDHMGEEVSLSWTAEEERKFKDMIKYYSTSTNKFWRIAAKHFPSKNREKLVRYYFNVLVLRRRSYQNRVTPKNLDSDDDEKDFGAVGSSFGQRAIHIADTSLQNCLENKQCTDLE